MTHLSITIRNVPFTIAVLWVVYAALGLVAHYCGYEKTTAACVEQSVTISLFLATWWMIDLVTKEHKE